MAKLEKINIETILKDISKEHRMTFEEIKKLRRNPLYKTKYVENYMPTHYNILKKYAKI